MLHAMLHAMVMTVWAFSTAMVSTRMAQPLKTDRVVGIDRPYVDMGTCNSPKEFGVVERSAGMAMQRQLLSRCSGLTKARKSVLAHQTLLVANPPSLLRGASWCSLDATFTKLLVDESNKRRGRRLRRPHHAHHPHRPN